MLQLGRDIRRAQFSLVKNWNALNDTQKRNMFRVLTEAVYLIGLTVMGSILTELADDDEDEWLINMSAYQANRLFTEFAFYLDPRETFRIIKSPAAGVNQIQKILNFLEFWTWTEEYESGKYEGHSKFYKGAIQTIPLVETVTELVRPDEQLEFFTK
jgi:hypothetical protein